MRGKKWSDMPKSLDEGHALLKAALGNSDDIQFQPFTVMPGEVRALLVYTEGLTSSEIVQANVLQPLTDQKVKGSLPSDLAELGRQRVHLAKQRPETDPAQIRDEVFRGKAAVLVDGYAGALVLGCQGWEERPVQSPPTESPLRGPRDGFIENITHNVALVRRRLCDPTLRVKFFWVGARSKTQVAMLYMADIAPRALVHELRTRIAAVEFDGILDTSQLREILTGSGFSPFPKMETTERPDKVSAALLSGKVAVLTDNSPFAAVAPVTLMDSLWAPDDYYTSPAVAMLVRLVRTSGWAATLLLTPLYIALQMYNPELVRTDLVLFLARDRLGVPLTAAMEVYFLEIMMEMVLEATVRLPSKIGSAATVVGGLIIGQAAVQARLISGMVIIVVAISAIGSFTLPGQEMSMAWRVAKWALILAASVFGLFGLFLAAFCLLAWLSAQDSFGTPYLAPVAPFIPGDLARDSLYRQPWSVLRLRSKTYRARDQDRTGAAQVEKYRDGGER